MSSLGEKALNALCVTYSVHEYDFRKKGAAAAARALGIPLAATLKTLVTRVDDGRFVFLLVPGDRSVSMKRFARHLGVKAADLASEKEAERVTGYKVGGIGPFGSKRALPVYLDLAALDHDRIFFNGGRRGLLLGMDPEDLLAAAEAEPVDVAEP